MSDKMRIEQWKSESPDLFAMRAWAKALPLMDNNSAIAAANWITAYTQAKLKEREAKP